MTPQAVTAFVSYSRTDSEFALRLAQDLKAADANIWLDQLDIPPGKPWDDAIEDALKMLSRQFASRGITVERNFADLPKVYANPLQLEQVFINLASNARDAIEATGRGKGTIRIHTRNAGNFIEILFRDDGLTGSKAEVNLILNIL